MSTRHKGFNWREFIVLSSAGVVGVVAIIPYSLALQAPVLEKTPLPAPLEVILVVQVIQNALVIAIATGLGLLLATRVGLGAPLLEARLAGRPIGGPLLGLLPPSVGAGAAVGVVIILLDALIFAPAQPQAQATGVPAPWQGLLAALYGGITEELLLRLFLMSLLAWLLGLVWKESSGLPGWQARLPARGAFWVANVAAAILFGLGHLPTATVVFGLSLLVVLRIVLLNGLAGVVFGYLYWQRGLEAAMLAHFSADLVLHVLMPLSL